MNFPWTSGTIKVKVLLFKPYNSKNFQFWRYWLNLFFLANSSLLRLLLIFTSCSEMPLNAETNGSHEFSEVLLQFRCFNERSGSYLKCCLTLVVFAGRRDSIGSCKCLEISRRHTVLIIGASIDADVCIAQHILGNMFCATHTFRTRLVADRFLS